ncbi:transposase [Nitrosomonas sp. Nm51]|uniref:transposase n=1 Tax=Nitrosomonas sp. Nm51 TaxID=133720 RepID=UPI000B803492
MVSRLDQDCACIGALDDFINPKIGKKIFGCASFFDHAVFTTDLDLSIEQIIEYYGDRWKIGAGFKEIKQEAGSIKSQTRTPHAVMNHFNFCIMAAIGKKGSFEKKWESMRRIYHFSR